MSFLQHPTLLLFLTLGLYPLGIFLSAKHKWIIFNPIILTVAVMILYLNFLQIPMIEYEKAGMYIELFLKPSVVALAIPLYTQWGKIKKQIIPILFSQVIGCLVGIVSVVFIAKLLGAEKEIVISLIPKSVSTPIALEVSKSLQGIPSITAFSVMITGIFGGMIGFKFLSLSRITNPISKGIALGTSSHAFGTMKALDLSEKYGAFASVGMIVNGILTAVLAPLMIKLILPYL